MKCAYFGLPHIGGTYTVFRQLRRGLAEHAIDVRWLGRGQTSVGVDPAWKDEMAFGAIVDPQGVLAPADQASRLAAEIEAEGYAAVFVNVLADRVQMNLARYLPRHILRIMIVHSITPGTYSAARSLRDHVHATVAVSERCRRDLVDRHGFPPGRIVTIPNALRSDVQVGRRQDGERGRLKALFLGRIEDTSKGIFWLPAIMSRLPDKVSLTVAGDGPDLPALKKVMAQYSDRTAFLGTVPPAKVAALLAEHDVFIMPSRFEGYPMSLIEAMSAGCVPVASKIVGVTDTIVDHGTNGLLFPVGECREAARQIERLLTEPHLLSAMSSAASAKAANAFDLKKMANAYAGLISRVAIDPPAIAEPLRLADWRVPAGLLPGLRTYLPPRVKNWLRVARERIR